MKKSLFTAMAVGFGLTANLMAQVPSYVPSNGLVGWWPFNGNANDESGNGNNGTVNGATLTADRFGNSNKAYSFDGINNRIEVAHNSNLNLSSVSISCWINPNALLTPSGYGPTILSKREASGWGESIQMNIGNHDFWADWTIGSNNWILYTDSSNLLININTNAHLAYTHDASKVRLYLNGSLVKEINSPGLLSFNTLPLWFGARPNAGVNYQFFQGKIDDIGIWNRALTPQEISDLYNSTNCINDLTISPSINPIQTGNTANFTATTSDANSTVTWQSDFGQGFQTLNDFENYSGTSSNNLSISNVQLANHNQPIRAISTSSNCSDTSNIATIQIADTCITNVTDTTYVTVTDTNVVTIYDTLLTTVTDTLVINTTLSLPAPNNENTILIYPNPASDHITIDNGNYTAMAGYTIRIENNAGQQVFQSAINQQQFYVDMSTWSGNGLYFVHLIDPQNNTVTVRKIVLQ